MLNLYFSNRLECLTDLLLAQTARPSASVFTSVQIMVPNAAMQRHVTLTMAQRQGICANLRFDYLAQWLWRLLGAVDTSNHAQAPYDAAVLAWRIYDALTDSEWVSHHARLQSYLARADATQTHHLAQQLASAFEQYLTYRPDWLETWAQGKLVSMERSTDSSAADQLWQAALWQRLHAETGATSADPACTLRDALAQAHPAVTAWQGQTLHVFALPTLPPLHLRMLQLLAGHIDIALYALNPCSEFWFQVVDARRLAYLETQSKSLYHEVGNQLLAGWGQQTQSVLSQLVDAAGDALIEHAVFVHNEAPSLLAQVQNAVLALTDLQPASVRLTPDDRSLEIHVCHSLTREIEVVQTRLLALFAQDNPPRPDDIVVVTPDIDAAAPLIEAIFGTAPQALQIPYTITGRARTHTNAPARALVDLLALLDSRCTVTAVLGLLQQPVVARRFGLGPDSLDQVRDWLQDAGVHWALDANHRASHGLPQSARHTFADGMDRLFAAYAMPAAVTEPFAGLLPAGHVSGNSALHLGALTQFLDTLGALQQLCATPMLPAEWTRVLAQALDSVVLATGAELEDLRELQASLEHFATQLRQSGLQKPLPLALVRNALQELLDNTVRGGVPTGMVTFTSISSLRAMPYRMVCAIGLNDGSFPSAVRPTEFDLMVLQPRPGDRQRRLDDRNLFLDLLLCARQTVHLSYVGRNVRDNTMLAPSVLLSELLDYLIPAVATDPANPAALAEARARLLVEHPLQPFSPEAFRTDDAADPRLRSFHADYAQALRERALQQDPALPAEGSPLDADTDTETDTEDSAAGNRAAPPFFIAPLAEPEAQWNSVSLEQLQRFFRNPCRYLLEKRLQVALRGSEDELEDDEPLLPTPAMERSLAARLLGPLLDGASAQSAMQLALAGTELPEGAIGRAFLDREMHALCQFADRVRALTADPCLPTHGVTWACTLDNTAWQLHAALADLRPQGLVAWRFDTLRATDLLSVWLRHLVLCMNPGASSAPHSVWLGREGIYRLRPVEDATRHLHELLALYARGLREPVYFFPRTAWAYINNGSNPGKALGAWRPSRQNPFAEGADAAYRLALRGLPDPLEGGWRAFEECANTVFNPVMLHLVKPTP